MVRATLLGLAVEQTGRALRLIGLSAGAALAFAALLFQLASLVQSLATQGSVTINLWLFGGAGLLALGLGCWVEHLRRALATAWQDAGAGDAQTARVAVRILINGATLFALIAVLFVQSVAMFALACVLVLAHRQILIKCEATVIAATRSECEARHDVAADFALLQSGKASLAAYLPEALAWVRSDLRQGLIAEARETIRVEAAMTQLSLWGRSRWYGLVFFALIVLPFYGGVSSATLTNVALIMVFLDRLGAGWLTLARKLSEAEHPEETESWTHST